MNQFRGKGEVDDDDEEKKIGAHTKFVQFRRARMIR